MPRAFNLLLLAAVIGGALITYSMKYRAEVAAESVARLEATIAREREAIAVLKAEWSLLTQPARLQSIVEKNADTFQLAPVTAEQIVTIEEIPFAPAAEQTQEGARAER